MPSDPTTCTWEWQNRVHHCWTEVTKADILRWGVYGFTLYLLGIHSSTCITVMYISTTHYSHVYSYTNAMSIHRHTDSTDTTSTHINRWRSRLTTGFVHGATAMPRRFVKHGISMGILWDFLREIIPQNWRVFLKFQDQNFPWRFMCHKMRTNGWVPESPMAKRLTTSSDSWRVVEEQLPAADSSILFGQSWRLDINTSFKRNLWNMEHSPADVAVKIWRDFTLFGYHFYLQCCLRPNVDQPQTHFGNSHFSLWGHPQHRSS